MSNFLIDNVFKNRLSNRELENYRSVKIAYKNVMIVGGATLQGDNGRFIYMTVRTGNESSMYN